MITTARFIVLTSCLLIINGLIGQVQINEFMAINRTFKVGATLETVDWLELYNAGNLEVQLKDYYLTDDPADLTKFKIPALTLPAFGYRVLLQAEAGLSSAGKIPFSLSGEGEFVALVAPDGVTVLDSISFGQQYQDISFGRAENGNTWGILNEPSLGAENTVLRANLSQVSFALPSGIYQEDSLWVEAWIDHPNASIYYSLDGSEPDTNANLYNGPILLESSSTVRAKAFLDSASSVGSTFATYFLQSPKKHYILNLHAPDRRFNDPDSGILKISKYELGGWDNPLDVFNFWVDAELFSSEGVLLSRHKGRLKQHGAGSSYGIMKSMRLHLSASQAITEPIYRQKPDIESHRVIILRQGGNYSDWAGLAIQDVLTSEYLSRKGWDLDYQAYQPVNVYINGQFHALMFFRERHDEHYFVNNHQSDPDEVSVVRKYGFGGEFDTGNPQRFYDIESFINSRNFRDTANVMELAKLVDFDNYFKYLYLNDYIVNSDWPFNNFKIAHPGGTTDKWRFCVYDTDFAYQRLEYSGIGMLTGEQNNGFWLPKLMQNDSLREYFINYYLDLLNTEFVADEFEENLSFLVQYLGQDVQDHLLHWKPIIQASNGGPLDWDQYIESLRSPLSQRNSAARSHLSAAFELSQQIPLRIEISPSSAGHIQLNTLDLQDFPWTGTYLRRNPVNVTAIARPGYRFAGWADPLLPDSNHLRYELDASCTLTALFEVDSTYQPQLVINEIMYADKPSRKGGDWVELYNASDAPINLDQWTLGDQTSDNRFSFPAGTTLPPEQYIIICRDPSAFLGAFPGTSIVPRALGFGLGKTDAVRIWNPNGQLVDSVAYSNQAPWPQIADAQGASLALRDPQLKTNYPQNWISRSDYSPSPGRRNEIITTRLIQNRLSCIRFNAELFPNPMQSDFTLYFANSPTESIDLQFLDLLGREVHQQTVPLRLGANLVKIPVDFLAQGHYLLKMEQDGMTETVRIVKY